MAAGLAMKPFRWNIKKREQLGSLINVTADPAYPEYEEQLSDCAARVVARSQGRKLIFVGRSPENIFDYLSGVFEGTSHAANIDILNISNRFQDIERIKIELPGSYKALKNHYTMLGIAPAQVISNPQGVCICDLVSSGATYENIFKFMQIWAGEDKCDFTGVTRKLSFLGITGKTKNSPNTWRWQQNADWVKENNKLTVKNVSIPQELWDYLGNRQEKVSRTNKPESWGGDEIMLPPREHENIKALKQAYGIFCLGVEQRWAFSEKLASTQEFKESWLRSLVNELRKMA